MGSPADYTIIVMLVIVGVALWSTMDRLTALARDIDAIRRKLESERPPTLENE